MPLLPLLLLLLLLPSAAVAGKVRHSPSFALDFFPGDDAIAQLALTGANATSAGAISMRSPRARVQYHKPIRFAADDAGFSTYFSFSLHPATESRAAAAAAAASLAFFLAPAASSPTTSNALSVAFHAADPRSVGIQIDFAGEHYRLGAGISAGTQKLHSWIEYNATSTELRIGVSASPPHDGATEFSLRLDLSTLLRGGSSSRDKKLLLAGLASSHANCTLFSWAFRVNSGPPYLMHSLPLDPTGLPLATPPPERLHRAAAAAAAPSNRYHWVSLLLAAAAGAALTFFVLFVWYSMVSRSPVAPVEYPMHPSSSDVVYEKIVLVGVKDIPSAGEASAGNK